MNFLEQLVSEWLEYNGYFVRRNVQVGKRPKGGYECELDVVAFNPRRRHLVQVEPSMDSHSWAMRGQRYKKKFEAGIAHVPELFGSLKRLPALDQVALFGYGSNREVTELAGGRVMLVGDLLAEIRAALNDRSYGNQAVPEQYICLRTIQFVLATQHKAVAAATLIRS